MFLPLQAPSPFQLLASHVRSFIWTLEPFLSHLYVRHQLLNGDVVLSRPHAIYPLPLFACTASPPAAKGCTCPECKVRHPAVPNPTRTGGETPLPPLPQLTRSLLKQPPCAPGLPPVFGPGPGRSTFRGDLFLVDEWANASRVMVWLGGARCKDMVDWYHSAPVFDRIIAYFSSGLHLRNITHEMLQFPCCDHSARLSEDVLAQLSRLSGSISLSPALHPDLAHVVDDDRVRPLFVESPGVVVAESLDDFWVPADDEDVPSRFLADPIHDRSGEAVHHPSFLSALLGQPQPASQPEPAKPSPVSAVSGGKSRYPKRKRSDVPMDEVVDISDV